MESKLTCPECERGTNWNSDAQDWETCLLCNGSGDLLQGEMSELRARAILKAARDKCGGKVEEGGGATQTMPKHF